MPESPQVHACKIILFIQNQIPVQIIFPPSMPSFIFLHLLALVNSDLMQNYNCDLKLSTLNFFSSNRILQMRSSHEWKEQNIVDT